MMWIRQTSQDVTYQYGNSLDSEYAVRQRSPGVGILKVRENEVALAYCVFSHILMLCCHTAGRSAAVETC